MGLQLPDSWSTRSLLPVLTTCSVYFLLCQFVTTTEAFEPRETLPYSVLEYPNNGTVSQQPPAAAVGAVSAGNGSSRADRRKLEQFKNLIALSTIYGKKLYIPSEFFCGHINCLEIYQHQFHKYLLIKFLYFYCNAKQVVQFFYFCKIKNS